MTVIKPFQMKYWAFIAALSELLLMCASLNAAPPMHPEKAFRYAVESNSSEIIVNWTIEPGYYLYKKRMSFASGNPSLELLEPLFPAGESHEDEFFGKSEVYRNSAEIRIPYIGEPGTTAEIIVMSQGCADMGLCYPPQRWVSAVTLPGKTTMPKNALSQLINGQSNSNTPLPAEQAFAVSAVAVDAFNVRIDWDIEDGYYIYQNEIAATVVSKNAKAGQLQLPKGVVVDDLEYGITEVYFDTASALLPISRAIPDPGLLEVKVSFQGCKTDSICYPPQSTLVAVDLPAAVSGDIPTQLTSPVSEQSRLAELIIEGNILAVMGLFLGFGLLLAFTPCVLPMVPILSGIIAGQGKDITTLRAFLLSLTYVLGMALTYTLAGVLFAAAGQQVQALLQQAWIIIAVSVLFGVLALAMFGFFTLQLPGFLQTRISNFSGQQKTGTFVGTGIMGALSALVVTTCVAPPLVATLTVIAESGDAYRGGAALFALSMGMGFPLLVIGTSAGRLLPKAGAWMITIKEFFGFMMLGLAIWMLERLLPGGITMVLWALLLLGVAVRLWMLSAGFKLIFAAASKMLAIFLAGYSVITLYAAYQGDTNPFNSIASINGTQQQHLRFIQVKTIADLDNELAKAKANDQYVMFDFYADWCVSCKEMDYYTFTDPAVQEALANTRLLQADVTKNDEADQALLQRMGIFGPPTIVFFDSSGEEIEEKRVIGFQSADVFREHLRSVLR